MAQLMLEILFPGGITEEFRAAHTVNTLAFWNVCSYQYTMKCLDVESGEIVGMMLGDMYVKERTPEERKNFGVPWLEGADRERAEKILTPLWEVKEKLWGGRPYICNKLPKPGLRSLRSFMISSIPSGKMTELTTYRCPCCSCQP